MTDDFTTFIAELRALRDKWGLVTARVAFEQRTATLSADQRVQLEALVFGAPDQGGAAGAGTAPTMGDVQVRESARVHGPVTGVNVGTIQAFFGAQPPTDGKALLDSYLEWLLAEYGRLRLGKLLGKTQSGREQEIMPALSLRAVYTSLATTAWIAGERFALKRDAILTAMDAGNPAQVLPDMVRVAALQPAEAHGRDRPETPWHPVAGGESLADRWQAARRAVADAPTKQPLHGQWYRPETPLTALNAHPRLVLLGRPGSGKSTVLRYLTIILAEALLAGTDAQRSRPIPLFCQLGHMAQAFGDDPAHDVAMLVHALLQPVFGPAGIRADLRAPILQAWRRGSALICLDGLDEVSGVAEATSAGQHSRRERMATAIRQLARQLGQTRIVVTCRTRPYEQDAAWQLREDWTVRTLQPFAFGQVRHFVPAWYAQTCTTPQPTYTHADAQTRAERLVTALEQRAALQELTTTPLLVTMLALLDYNHKELPEKRVDVYEELVKLLLDRWEGVRSSDQDQPRQSLGERLGLPHLTSDDLRRVIHDLAFTAHQQAVDGRGVLTGPLLRDKLDAFFRQMLNPAHPQEVTRTAAVQCSEQFEQVLREETGLVQEEADEAYVLPHLTFEEYLAACHLAGREDLDLTYAMWGQSSDRWREVILLLMGRLLRQEKIKDAYSWLDILVSERCGDAVKPPAQRQRDALLAAACYTELGRRTPFSGRSHDIIGFEDRLRTALVTLLDQPDATMLLPQRIEAGDALAALGDPRVPVTVEEWRRQLAQRSTQFGTQASYLCAVRAGTYAIGGWERNTSPVNITLPAFWIARFPITVAQYAPFVAAGYGPDAEHWWTPNGWQWKGDRMQPWRWNELPYDGANQPVVGVTWYEATAFCVWLTETMQHALPDGSVIRLPTEAEWEVAAAYDAQWQRRPYPWGDAEPTPEHAIFEDDEGNNLGQPTPIGCCPAGTAACGALDMAGNVWEVTMSSGKAYPTQSDVGKKDFINRGGDVPWRGGSWRQNKTYVRCEARNCSNPGSVFGFRVVLAPLLAHMP